MKKRLFVSFALMFVFLLTSSLYGQFPGRGESFASEPDIETQVKYEEGKILFKISLDENYHITDIKNGFFKIEVKENDYIDVLQVNFPKGTPYADELIYKGNVEVPVYVKQKKAADSASPATLTFKVSYQICQEHPQEICFPPASKDITVKIEKAFKEAKIEPKKETAEAAADTAATGSLKDLSAQGSAIAFKPKGGNWVVLLMVAIVLLAIGIFLGLAEFLDDDGIAAKFGKALMVLLLLGGSFLFLKSMDIKFFPSKYAEKPESQVKLDWIKNLEEGKELAKKENKTVLIDTYADWCIACKELEEYTFSDPEVAETLKNYVLVKVDFTKQNEANEKLRSDLKVIGMPTLILLDPEGKEIRRKSGFQDKDQFMGFLGSLEPSWFDKLLNLLKEELDKKSLLLFGLVFFLGFLTSLTPCVYPVIPIVMGYIGTRSGDKKLKGFYLSIFFVLGLAVVYSVFGVIAAMSGSMMGVSFQNPIVVIVISAIFMVMGLSLAGLFDIPVPSSLSSKMSTSSGKGEIIGSLIVGGISGIIAAPCVGPVLIALLSWISQSGNIFLGFWLTFIFSLGMGIIFLLAGTFSGAISAMPKGGNWMNYIKYFFAALLIGGGIYILNSIAPAWVSFLLWGVFLVALAVFMGIFTAHDEYKIKQKIYKLVVAVIFLMGIFLFFKALEMKFFTVSPTQQTQAEMVSVEKGEVKK